MNFIFILFWNEKGFTALVNQIVESKKSDLATIEAKLNSVSGPSTAGTTVKK